MVEGLRSTDAAILSVTRSWVKTALSGKSKDDSLVRLLQPALKILLKPDSQRKPVNKKPMVRITLSQEDAEKDMKYAQYYFQSLGIENPYSPSVKVQFSELLLCYRQLIDASQLLYALSLVESVVAVDPTMFVLVSGNIMVDVSMVAGYGGLDFSIDHPHRVARECGTGVDKPKDSLSGSSTEGAKSLSPSHAMHKSLLELLLSVCVDLLRSEYHATLTVSTEDVLEGLKVKVASASLLSTLLEELLNVLAEKKKEGLGVAKPEAAATTGGSGMEWKVLSPSFVSALIALCDIQLVGLLLLGKSVQWWEEAFCSSQSVNSQNEAVGISWASLAAELSSHNSCPPSYGNSLSVLLHSLNAQMLRVVQCLIVLDTQLSLSYGGEPNHHGHMQPHVLPANKTEGITTTSGVQLISSPSDSDISRPISLPAVLPGSLTASQPYFREFLLHVLRCPSLSSFHGHFLHMFSATISNLLHQQVLELAPNLVKQLCENIEYVVRHKSAPTEKDLSKGHFCVTYLKSVLDVVRWSMFGMIEESNSTGKRSYTLRSRLQNSMYGIVQVIQAGTPKQNFSPTLKQTSAMSWLLGVFSVSQKASLSGLGSSGSVGGSGAAGARDKGVAGEGGGAADTLAQSSHGVDSLVGQHVLMLLPAIYNAMATVWTNLYIHVGGARKGTDWSTGSCHMDTAVTEVGVSVSTGMGVSVTCVCSMGNIFFHYRI